MYICGEHDATNLDFCVDWLNLTHNSSDRREASDYKCTSLCKISVTPCNGKNTLSRFIFAIYFNRWIVIWSIYLSVDTTFQR